MGLHNDHKLFHRRVAALKQRRLPPHEEAAKLKELIARFSPTFIWTATLTDSIPLIPLPTLPAFATPTAASDDSDGDGKNGNGLVTTSSAPTPAPVTVPTVPTTTSTPVVNTNTVVAPNPVAQTTQTAQTAQTIQTTNAVPTTSTTTVLFTDPVTTSTPPAVVTKPGVTPLSLATTPGPVTSVTITSSTVSLAAASATETDSSESGTNVGGIVGGVVGGLLAVAALIFVIRFLLNRQRRRNDEISAAAFNAHDFRRSAVLMEDPPTHDETVERGFNPRPPTMIERRLASPAPTFGTQYVVPAPVMGHPDYGYNQYQAYGPTQMMPPNSATAMLNNSPYPNMNSANNQSPFSPIATPVGGTFNEENHHAAVLTRQSSNGSRASSAHGPDGYPSQDPNHGGSASPKQSDYIDLNRSSVTPFQAAQYTEISQKLGTEVPSGTIIQQSKPNEVAPPVPMKDNQLSSPFSDPMPGQLSYPGEVSPRPSTDSVSRQIDDFPVPPSPVHSNLSRVDSVPPMLPEIPMGSRPSSYNFPASDHENYIPNNTTKEYSKSPLGTQSPATPSPLASGVGVLPPQPAATSQSVAAPLTPRQNKFEIPAKRPDTVYDDQDAYGGI